MRAVLAKNCLRRKALDQGQAAVRPTKPTPVLQALLKGDRHKLFAIFCCFVFFFHRMCGLDNVQCTSDFKEMEIAAQA